MNTTPTTQVNDGNPQGETMSHETNVDAYVCDECDADELATEADRRWEER